MNRVLILRLVYGIKTKDLAKSAGISIALLSMIESGKREPSLTTYRNLALALNVPVSVLIDGMIQDKKAKKISAYLSEIETAFTKLTETL